MHSPSQPRFVAESTLGKLSKWLRMAGFDTSLDDGTPNAHRLRAMGQGEDRIVLTRTQAVYQRLDSERDVMLTEDHPEDQIRQVIHRCGLQRRQCRPFSRCLICNRRVERCPVQDAQGQVPEHILFTQEDFSRCPHCRRIFWQGSHRKRSLAMIDGWFAH